MPDSARPVAPAACLVLAWLALPLGGCCVGGPRQLSLFVEGQVPRWGEVMVVSPEPAFEASFDEDDAPAGALFELYDAEGAPVGLVVMSVPWEDNPDPEGACPHAEQVATVSAALPPGDYLLVHRRANGTGDDPSCGDGCPWTVFDGEEAIVLTLRVVASARGGDPGQPPSRRATRCPGPARAPFDGRARADLLDGAPRSS